jgi:hypothetical protein
MQEILFIGIAVAASIGTFVLVSKKSGNDCIP